MSFRLDRREQRARRNDAPRSATLRITLESSTFFLSFFGQISRRLRIVLIFELARAWRESHVWGGGWCVGAWNIAIWMAAGSRRNEAGSIAIKQSNAFHSVTLLAVKIGERKDRVEMFVHTSILGRIYSLLLWKLSVREGWMLVYTRPCFQRREFVSDRVTEIRIWLWNRLNKREVLSMRISVVKLLVHTSVMKFRTKHFSNGMLQLVFVMQR